MAQRLKDTKNGITSVDRLTVSGVKLLSNMVN